MRQNESPVGTAPLIVTTPAIHWFPKACPITCSCGGLLLCSPLALADDARITGRLVRHPGTCLSYFAGTHILIPRHGYGQGAWQQQTRVRNEIGLVRRGRGALAAGHPSPGCSQ